MSNVTSRNKKNIPLSLVGKLIHASFTLILLALLTWMLLLVFAAGIVIMQGWESAQIVFEHALLGMTSHLWIAPSDNHVISIFLRVTQFVLERCQVFAMGLREIFAFALLGFVDGLVQRDIRKFQNARESTLFFHRSKSLCVAIFFVSYFLFVLIPIDIPLAFCLLTVAIVLGCGIQATTKQFKKHL